MNEYIRRLDPEKLLFFDIETASRNENLDPKSKEYELFSWFKRDKLTTELPPQEEVLEAYKLEAALKPEYNRIICISVGFLKGGVLYYKSLKGTQKEMIEEFYGIVRTTGFLPTGFNIIRFDIPVVRIKGFEEGVDLTLLPSKFEDSMAKPWIMSEALIDCMDVIKGTGYNNISLDAACMLAGIESPKEGIKGADVSKAYYDGRLPEIREYCNRDIIATAKLFLKIQGGRYSITEQVCKDDVEIKSTDNMLQQLIAQDNLTAEFKVWLEKATKDMEDAELHNVKELVTAHYLKPKVKKAIQEARIAEVDQMFHELKKKRKK